MTDDDDENIDDSYEEDDELLQNPKNTPKTATSFKTGDFDMSTLFDRKYDKHFHLPKSPQRLLYC